MRKYGYYHVLTALLLLLGILGWQGAQAQQDPAIAALTQQQVVVDYLRAYQRLPDYYVTKQRARKAGWSAQEGNLCQVLPDKAIGGDRFANREQRLPDSPGRIWREADINYRCGHRGNERLLYSSDGLLYVTHDHYRRVQQIE